jgi:ferredoxin-thioredoxin reductase catalytic subunit
MSFLSKLPNEILESIIEYLNESEEENLIESLNCPENVRLKLMQTRKRCLKKLYIRQDDKVSDWHEKIFRQVISSYTRTSASSKSHLYLSC